MSSGDLATERTMLTPPEIARRWGVSPETVIGWVRSGQLRAVDVSSRPGIGRPRFRIDIADLSAFENRRQVIPRGKNGNNPSRRRRRKPAGVVEFF